MSLTSRLGFGLALGLIAGFSTPMVAPAILSNSSSKNSFTSSFAQTQTAQAQTAQAQTAAFSDVSTDYWAHDYIEGLAKSSVISGFPDGTFRPNELVTRAQFAAILHQAFLQSQPTTAQPFVDVPAGYWAADDIYATRAAGFLAGYPDKSFEPDANITRVHALVSLANGLKYTAGSLTALSAYEDADLIAPYARPSIAAATEANLVVNYPYPERLFVFGNASRADVAAYVYQALVKEGRAEPLAAKIERRWQTDVVVTIPTAIEQMSLSGSGQQIATIPIGGNKLQIWNTQTGALLKEISADNTRFNAVAMSQDGTKVAAVDQKSSANTIELSVWSVETGDRLWQKSLGSAEGQPPHTDIIVEPSVELAFSLNDSQIVTQVNLGSTLSRQTQEGPTDELEKAQLSIYDAATGNALQSLDFDVEQYNNTGLDFNLKNLTLSADGNSLSTLIRVSSASMPEAAQDFMSIWQRDDNGRFENTYVQLLSPAGKNEGSLGDMTFTNSGFLNVLTGNPTDGWNQLETINLQMGAWAGLITPPNADRTDFSTRLSPDGEYYFVRGDVAGSRLGNVQTREVQNLGGDEQDTAAMFSRNGDYLAVASPQKIRIFSKSL